MMRGVIFFFKQKTAYEIGTGDWSSDVCSSDLKPDNSRFGDEVASHKHRNGYSRTHSPRKNLPQSKIGRASCRERV